MRPWVSLALILFGAYYLIDMALTGAMRSRLGTFFRRSEDPTMFWAVWAIVAVGYAFLLWSETPVVVQALR